MLHEVLIALSGHPSPLFRDNKVSDSPGQAQSQEDFSLLSTSEKALLQSIGQLSELHRKLRHHIQQTVLNHASTICRAVATSIQEVHLGRFQDKILSVESKILAKDTSIVGAYDIVPLAGIVGEFDDWHRLMQWYWDIACFIQPADSNPAKSPVCSGAALIDKLRMEQRTGFPDVEQVAIELSKVAETAWLRQLASWVLYGKPPVFGTDDFFIQARNADDEVQGGFSKDKDLLPKFVTASTASSVLFIGRSLHQVKKYGQQVGHSKGLRSQLMSERELTAAHLQKLSSLSLPIVSAQLSRAISAIRLSLSQNILKTLLPMEMTLELLACLKQFFLLARSEFATALIDEADNRLQVRQESMGRLLQQDPVKALKGLSIKDREFQQSLSQTWKTLASQNEDIEDDVLEFARSHISFSASRDHDSRPSTSESVNRAAPDLASVAFNDLLFPSAGSLGLQITPPLDLFVSQSEMETYSVVNAYLLALRRAGARLSDLWRQTPARRDHSVPRRTLNKESRERIARRRTAARKVWATCSAAFFMLSETSAYLEGEIIGKSWENFEDWVKKPNSTDQPDDLGPQTSIEDAQGESQKDPETLASGHRAFLAALTYALLLNDLPYTKELRSLLGNVDSLVAFFNRLLKIQQKLNVEHEAGGETGYTVGEEQRIALELDRARKKVDSDLKSVMNKLRQLDHERIGSARYLDTSGMESEFEPWKGGGVDRLLMKLEFGRTIEVGFDIV